MNELMFADRRHAGRVMGQLIAREGHWPDAIVLGLVRGGVPVAFEIATACGLPLDILAVRKLGAPGQPELAMGAVTRGGTAVLNEDVVRAFHISDVDLQSTIVREQAQAEHNEQAYRQGRPPIQLKDRCVILVDDGLATGASMRAAIRAVRSDARQVVVAIPVGARSTCDDLAKVVDRVICPVMPERFEAVSLYYQNFEPTTEDEIRELLAAAAASR